MKTGWYRTNVKYKRRPHIIKNVKFFIFNSLKKRWFWIYKHTQTTAMLLLLFIKFISISFMKQKRADPFCRMYYVIQPWTTPFSLIPLQFAAVTALCIQYEADFRPNMSVVVKALQPLLNPRPGPGGERQNSKQ